MTDKTEIRESAGSSVTDVLRRLAPYFAPYRAQLILVGMLLVVGTLVDLAVPYLLGLAIDQVLPPQHVTNPAWLSALVGSSPSSATSLRAVMLLLGSMYLVSWGLNVVQFRIMVRTSQGVLLRLRAEILEKLHSLSLAFFDEHQAGDLMSRLTSDTQVINDMFGPDLMRLLRMLLSLIGIVIAMVSLNWRLAIAAFAILPVIVVATAYLSRRVRRAYRETRQTIGDVSAELQENIAGVREVQAFAREQETMGEFRAVNERNRNAHVRAGTLSAVYSPVLDVLSTLALACVIAFGGYLALRFSPPLVTVGVIVSFTNYVRRFYDPIREMAGLYGQLQSAVAASERIFDLLDTCPGVSDSPDAIVLPEPVSGHIRYEDVSFRYREDEPVLNTSMWRCCRGRYLPSSVPRVPAKAPLSISCCVFTMCSQGASCWTAMI